MACTFLSHNFIAGFKINAPILSPGRDKSLLTEYAMTLYL